MDIKTERQKLAPKWPCWAAGSSNHDVHTTAKLLVTWADAYPYCFCKSELGCYRWNDPNWESPTERMWALMAHRPYVFIFVWCFKLRSTPYSTCPSESQCLCDLRGGNGNGTKTSVSTCDTPGRHVPFVGFPLLGNKCWDPGPGAQALKNRKIRPQTISGLFRNFSNTRG